MGPLMIKLAPRVHIVLHTAYCGYMHIVVQTLGSECNACCMCKRLRILDVCVCV